MPEHGLKYENNFNSFVGKSLPQRSFDIHFYTKAPANFIWKLLTEKGQLKKVDFITKMFPTCR